MIINKFADLLNYDIEPIVLYQVIFVGSLRDICLYSSKAVSFQDMTARDLIQQRETLNNGDTIWRNSPLVTAALEGKIALLDGIHRVHTSTLAILHRFAFCHRFSKE